MRLQLCKAEELVSFGVVFYSNYFLTLMLYIHFLVSFSYAFVPLVWWSCNAGEKVEIMTISQWGFSYSMNQNETVIWLFRIFPIFVSPNYESWIIFLFIYWVAVFSQESSEILTDKMEKSGVNGPFWNPIYFWVLPANSMLIVDHCSFLIWKRYHSDWKIGLRKEIK